MDVWRDAEDSALPHFEVGDRVEYRSDTYNHWMLGTIQRVREGGRMYDLDVKRGAQAGKLRLVRSSSSRSPRATTPTPSTRRGGSSALPVYDSLADDIFSRMDTNNDGVITRREFQAGLDSNLVHQATEEANTARLGFRSLADPVPLSARGSRPPTAPVSSNESQKKRNDCQGGGGADRGPPRIPRHRRATSLERHLHEKIDEAQSEHLVSRAGATTLRKMTDMTKSLIEGLEGALIARAGFIAGVFHSWHCETVLSRMSRLYHEEFERRREEWAGCLDEHRHNFETQLRAKVLQKQELAEKVAHQKMTMVMAWSNGSNEAFQRQHFLVWSSYSKQMRSVRKSAASTQRAVFAWVAGNEKGTLISCLRAWRQAVQGQREVDRAAAQEKEAEAAKLAMEERLEAERMEGRLAKMKAMSSVLARSLLSNTRGIATRAMHAWHSCARSSRESKRIFAAVGKRFLNSMMAKEKGNLSFVFQQWKLLGDHCRAAREFEKAHDEVRKNVAKEREAHQAELDRLSAEAERLRAHSQTQLAYALSKWGFQDAKALLRLAMGKWKEVAKMAKAKQGVHLAMAQHMMGQQKATLQCSFQSWQGLYVATKQAQAHKANLEEQDAEYKRLMEEAEARAQDAMAKVSEKVKSTVAMAAQNFLGGKTGDLRNACFTAWKGAVQKMRARQQKSQQIKGAMLRFMQGEEKGRKQQCFSAWKDAYNSSKVDRAAQMEAKAAKEAYQAREKALVVKAAGMVGGRRNAKAVLRENFSSWYYVLEKARVDRVHAARHAKSRDNVSKFVIGQMLRKDSSTFLSSVVAEWDRVARASALEQVKQHAGREQSEAEATMLQMEKTIAELQAQVATYQEHMRMITQTLQKELKTKEELAGELRSAYDQLRRTKTGLSSGKILSASSTLQAYSGPPQRCTPSTCDPRSLDTTGAFQRNFSRNSSEQTLDTLERPLAEDLFEQTLDTLERPLAEDLFEQLDTNNDGVISRSEFRAAVVSGDLEPGYNRPWMA